MSFTTNFATSTATGSRSNNEDFEYAMDWGNFAMVLIMDGHNGTIFKDKLGSNLITALSAFFEDADEDLQMELCIETINLVLKSILEKIDEESPSIVGGTTLSLGLMQKKTRFLYTFQIGDSMVFMADTSTDNIANACKIYASDEANKYKNDFDLGYQSCITTIHDFTNNTEKQIFTELCKSSNKKFTVTPRRDACKEEGRVNATINYVSLPEPSRTIENLDFYIKNNLLFIKETQRTPEVSVWHFNCLDNLVLCAACDGFVSKLCLSSSEKIAQVIINPGKFICNPEILDGTLIGKWLVNPNKWPKHAIKPENCTWNENPILHANRLVHYIAPDLAWKNAVQTSLDTITDIKERFPDEELNIKTHIQECLDLAVQIPISLASDDNVSACVVVF